MSPYGIFERLGSRIVGTEPEPEVHRFYDSSGNMVAAVEDVPGFRNAPGSPDYCRRLISITRWGIFVALGLTVVLTYVDVSQFGVPFPGWLVLLIGWIITVVGSLAGWTITVRRERDWGLRPQRVKDQGSVIDVGGPVSHDLETTGRYIATTSP